MRRELRGLKERGRPKTDRKEEIRRTSLNYINLYYLNHIIQLIDIHQLLFGKAVLKRIVSILYQS